MERGVCLTCSLASGTALGIVCALFTSPRPLSSAAWVGSSAGGPGGKDAAPGAGAAVPSAAATEQRGVERSFHFSISQGSIGTVLASSFQKAA